MTEKKTTDTELEAYLEGDSPLSNLYHQDQETAPNKHVDETILNAARAEAEKQNLSPLTQNIRWYKPIALAASLLVAIMIIRVSLINNSQDTDQLADSPQPSTTGQHLGAGKASPQIMLEKINRLAIDGKKEQASQEYELFVELFPDHDIDLKKYPGIQSLLRD